MRARLSNRLALRVAGAFAVVAIGAGIGLLVGGGEESPSTAPITAGGKAETGPVFLDDLLPRAPGAADRAFVRRTVTTLSDREKVGQVFAWGLAPGTLPPERVRSLRSAGLGAVVVAGTGDQRGLGRALGARDGRAPFVLTDDDGADPRALRRAGIRGALGPRLDVGGEDDVADITGLARADVTDYRDATVLAAPTPFPGLGAAAQLPDAGPSNVTLSARQLQRRDIRPFRAAVQAGAPAIQVSNGLYTYDDFVTPGSLSRTLIQGQLRNRLGFGGVVITGNLIEAGVTALEPPSRAAPDALRAGADLLYIGGSEQDQRAAFDAVLRALRAADARTARLDAERRRKTRKGDDKSKKPAPVRNAFRERLDEAAERVLTAKRDYGLLR